MSSWEILAEERVIAGELIAEITSKALAGGASQDDWPGLTVYHFSSPSVSQWESVRSLSLCVVAQGRKLVTVNGQQYSYDPFQYLVLTRGMEFQAEIVEASEEKPFLSFVLQIDPAIVRRVAFDMTERTLTTFRRPLPQQARDAYVSPVDPNIMGAVLRFLRATRIGQDRRVLAPMHLQEVVYRILQTKQRYRLIEAAEAERESNPVTEVINYIRRHMSRPVTVTELAEQVSMSPSAFSHLFRDTTGLSPYQFVKKIRLQAAQKLLVEKDLTVSEVARRVGYASLPHFINEFKRQFGATPRTYARQRRVPLFDVDTATARR